MSTSWGLDAAAPLIQTATGSLIGNLRDKGMSAFGQDTEASRAAAQLAAIGGQLTSKMPRMEGPQSNSDRQLYEEMAGQLGNPNVTSGNKLAAAKIIRQLNEKYLSQNRNSMPAAAARAVQGGGGLTAAEEAELAQLRAELGRK